MGIRYTSKLKYNLVFDFLVDGEVNESDVIGAMLTLTSSFNLNYGIIKLQNLNKLGKVELDLKHLKIPKKELEIKTKGTIKISTDLDRAETSIFCSIIEQIKKIKLYSCTISLKEITDAEQVNSSIFLNRAVEIYSNYFQSQFLDPDNLKRSLFEMTSSKKVTSVGSFTLGASFKESNNILVVEGRADVAKLFDCGITNTFALGGLFFEVDAVKEFLKSKAITLFLDGDVGGKEILKKLDSLDLNITHIIEAPEKISVEDLSKTEILNLIKNRRIYTTS